MRYNIRFIIAKTFNGALIEFNWNITEGKCGPREREHNALLTTINNYYNKFISDVIPTFAVRNREDTLSRIYEQEHRKLIPLYLCLYALRFYPRLELWPNCNIEWRGKINNNNNNHYNTINYYNYNWGIRKKTNAKIVSLYLMSDSRSKNLDEMWTI